ncbi:MAG: hypothetical protein FWE03_06580 [Firmicutes bacterium]|nr:hypothetical protein [Bacillota bacterium]
MHQASDENLNLEDNPNEIHNTPPIEKIKKVSVRRVLSFAMLGIAVAIAIVLIWGTLADNEVINIIRNPRGIIFPVSFIVTYIMLLIKPSKYAKNKDEIAKIIASFEGESMTIKEVAGKYKEGKSDYQNVEEKYIMQEVAHRVIDLLWAGRLPGYKYVLDIDCVVRVHEDENQIINKIES